MVTMQCSDKETFDKVNEVIATLKSLDDNFGVDGETMEYILEQVGMNDQMLRQLVMGNPEIIVNELLDEKVEISERYKYCKKVWDDMLNNDTLIYNSFDDYFLNELNKKNMQINESQEVAIDKILNRVSEVEGKEILHTVENYLDSGMLLLRIMVEGLERYKYSINSNGVVNKL
jgi:hypothetical protein